MNRTIYLDNHATTPLDPRVLDAMMPFLTTEFGNASSGTHSYGWRAQHAVEGARGKVAGLLNATPDEIVFTSGATEANNLAIKGIAERYGTQGSHIITAVTEHHAVLDPCKLLERRGFDVTYLSVDRFGIVDPERVAASITDRTILVSIMMANNEIGTLQQMAAIGRICRERNVWLHSDATQAVGKVPVDVEMLKIDLLSFSAHKMYGPKGIGALYVRGSDPKPQLAAQIIGGGQERNRRSGTLNVPAIVGAGEAAAICKREMDSDDERVFRLRERLFAGLQQGIDGLNVHGHPTERLSGNLNISFDGVHANVLMGQIPNIAVSTGAACTTDSLDVSYVLKAIGIPLEEARCAIRFGIGRFTTEDEIDETIERYCLAVKRLRQ